MITLGLLLSGLEGTVTRNTWRYATAAQQAYFTALQQWGYPLSDVEQLVLAPTPELTTEPETEPGPGSDAPSPTGDNPTGDSPTRDETASDKTSVGA